MAAARLLGLAFFAAFRAGFPALFLAAGRAAFLADFLAAFRAPAFFPVLFLAAAFFRGAGVAARGVGALAIGFGATGVIAGGGGGGDGGGGGGGEELGMGSIQPEPDHPISMLRNTAMLASQGSMAAGPAANG